LVKEFIQAPEISKEEYEIVVERGAWLNEQGSSAEAPPSEEELEEE